MVKNENVLKEIIKILKEHEGKHNQISAGVIAEMLNMKQEDTHVEPRTCIKDAMIKYRVPIAAGGKGYYIIKNEEELKDYIEGLENRVDKIMERKKQIEDIYKEYYKN